MAAAAPASFGDVGRWEAWEESRLLFLSLVQRCSADERRPPSGGGGGGRPPDAYYATPISSASTGTEVRECGHAHGIKSLQENNGRQKNNAMDMK